MELESPTPYNFYPQVIPSASLTHVKTFGRICPCIPRRHAAVSSAVCESSLAKPTAWSSILSCGATSIDSSSVCALDIASYQRVDIQSVALAHRFLQPPSVIALL